MTNQQKLYLLDAMIVNMETTIERLELSSLSGYATFLAAAKTQRTAYYTAYNTDPDSTTTTQSNT